MGELANQHQIHGVQPVLPVPDVVAAADWFVRVLGFELDFVFGSPPVHARVKVGDGSWGATVYIHLTHSDKPSDKPSEKPITACGMTRLHVGHDIDGLHAHVLACGANVLQAPTDQPWGLREFLLEAPGGHRLCLGAEVQPVDVAPRAT